MDEETASVAAEQQLLAELDADSSCKVMKATKKAKKQSKARKVKQLEQTLERDASAVDDEVTQQLCADMLGAPCANFPKLTYEGNTVKVNKKSDNEAEYGGACESVELPKRTITALRAELLECKQALG